MEFLQKSLKNLFEICKKIKKELNIPLKEWKNDLNYANSGKNNQI